MLWINKSSVIKRHTKFSFLLKNLNQILYNSCQNQTTKFKCFQLVTKEIINVVWKLRHIVNVRLPFT